MLFRNVYFFLAGHDTLVYSFFISEAEAARNLAKMAETAKSIVAPQVMSCIHIR